MIESEHSPFIMTVSAGVLDIFNLSLDKMFENLNAFNTGIGHTTQVDRMAYITKVCSCDKVTKYAYERTR